MAAQVFRAEEWEDVARVPQDDGPDPVVAINYSPEYIRRMDIFRGIMRTGELSERVYRLTEAIINLNPAHYTVWMHRWNCIKELDLDLEAEIGFMNRVARISVKNYQLWQHRRLVISRRGNATGELEHTEEALREDAKNYHAWAHRQWVLETFGEWEEELAFTEQLLEEDVRNNSAWNHRWFVLDRTTEMGLEVRQREVDFALERLELVLENEAAWNFVRGLCRGLEMASSFPRLVEWVDRVHATEKGAASPSLQAFRVEQLRNAGRAAEAMEVCELLASDLDRVRAPYWRAVRRQMETSAGAGTGGD